MGFFGRLYELVIGRRVFGRRVEILCNHFAELVPQGAKVLDVGCGNGLLAHRLQERRPDITVQGIDVLVQNRTHIPVQKFDGTTFPFPDKSFDVVMFVDVLHHTEDAMTLLREAVRVAGQAILLKDHPRDGFLAGPTLRFMDWVANRRYGIALPYNYWPRKKWFDAFQALHLTADVWKTKLGLYRPLGFLFGRGLHFIARLVPASAENPSLSRPAGQ